MTWLPASSKAPAATRSITISAGTRPRPAAGTARLLDLDPARFTSALGIAGTFTGGIWSFIADGAMTKRFHPGKAAENGLSATLLARAGMTGPRHVLDAEWGGFLATYCRETARPEAVL